MRVLDLNKFFGVGLQRDLLSCDITGPLLGFVGSGIFLSTWVDLIPPPDGIDRDDKEWVGAWWFPFIIIAFLSFINSLYLYNFPDKVSGKITIASDSKAFYPQLRF